VSELPEGWTGCLIGDVAQVIGGGTPDTKYAENFSESEGISWLTPADLSGYSEIYISRGKRFLTKVGLKSSSARLLPKGAVLFSSRAPIGYVAIAANEISTNQGFKSFIPAGGVISEYLYFYLKFAKPLADELASGTTFAEISGKNAARIPLLLAPTNEQRRIVAKLKPLLGSIETYQQRLVKIPVVLKRFRQAVLAAACSGRLTADWREQNDDVEPVSTTIEQLRRKHDADGSVRRGVPESVPVSDLVAEWELPSTWGRYSAAELLRCGAIIDLKDGNHGANHPKVSEFTEAGLPFITAAQVNGFRIDYDNAYKVSGEPLARLRVGFAKPGDVIYTHKGSVGRVAIADRDCVLTPQTTYYRISPHVFAKEFVMFYLASWFFSEQVDVVKEQTTRDFVPISEQYSLFHRVPPLPEQYEIVRRVEALFKLVDQIEARFRRAKPMVDKLPQSILAKAFRGELVPTEAELARREGRDYEPASVLLERIRSERAEHAQGRKEKARSQMKSTKGKVSGVAISKS
jgi:type I restriction enzyme S subunit